MATKRSYQDACGMAHALDLVGERWALLVVRELLLGPKRYSDLHTDLPGISTNVLSHRLTELERSGVLTRRRLPPPAASQVYELTAWGQELEPVIQQIGRWGARSPVRPRDAHLSLTSLIISLRTNFTPPTSGADGQPLHVELRVGHDRFTAAVEDGGLRIARPGQEPADRTPPPHTAPGTPHAVITADVPRLAGMIYGPLSLDEAVRSGEVAVSGDLTAAERFLALFPLPAPATLGGS